MSDKNEHRLAQGEDYPVVEVSMVAEGHAVGLYMHPSGDTTLAHDMIGKQYMLVPVSTQPPHQDRGEVNLDQVDAALFCTPVTDDGDELAMPIDCMNMGTPEQLPLARTIMRAALTAALPEAKQQTEEVLAHGWFHALPDGDYEFHDETSGAGKYCPRCVRAKIVRE